MDDLINRRVFQVFEIDRTTHIHRAGDPARIPGQRCVGIIARLTRAEAGHEVSAGRMSDCTDSFRINAKSFRIGPHPAHRALDIVELRGPAVAAIHCQPVVDGKTDVSKLGERSGTLGKRILISSTPTAAMHPDHSRLQGRFFWLQIKGIKQQLLSASFPVDYIAFRRHFRRLAGSEKNYDEEDGENLEKGLHNIRILVGEQFFIKEKLC